MKTYCPLVFILIALLLSSCLTTQGLIGDDKPTKSGTVDEFVEIKKSPDIKDLMLSFGGRKMIGGGLDGTLMTEKSIRYDASLFAYLNGPLPTSSGRLFEKHFLSMTCSFPLLKRSTYRPGKITLLPYGEGTYSGKIYYMKRKFLILRMFNLVGGVEHGFTHFNSKAYRNDLAKNNPEKNLILINRLDKLCYTGLIT